MRLIQLLFGLGLSRGQSTSKLFAWAAALLLIFISVVSQAVVYMTVLNVDGQVQIEKEIWQQTGYCVLLELVAWDGLVMPFFLAIGGKITNRVITRFTALMV